jgi:hypothetical protein
MFLLHQPMKSVCPKSPPHKLMSRPCPPYPHAKSFEMYPTGTEDHRRIRDRVHAIDTVDDCVGLTRSHRRGIALVEIFALTGDIKTAVQYCYI